MTRDKGITIILDLHENRPEIMKYYMHVNTFLGKLLIYTSIWKKFEKRYIQKADKTIVITEEAKDYYMKAYGVSDKQFLILPNAVSRRFFEDYERKEEIIERYKQKFVILYLGNTNERRGMLTVLEAVRLLKARIPNLLFLCAGKSKRDPHWEQVVKEKGIKDHVELLGWQDFDLFPSFVESCDIGLCPLERNIHHDTTLANKLFQYMAFGKPVVVSDCAAQAKLMEEYECGLVFEAGNAADLQENCYHLYNRNELRIKYGKYGKKLLLSNYLWENRVQHLSKLYQSLTCKN